MSKQNKTKIDNDYTKKNNLFSTLFLQQEKENATVLHKIIVFLVFIDDQAKHIGHTNQKKEINEIDHTNTPI